MAAEFICNVNAAQTTSNGLNPPDSIVQVALTDTGSTFVKQFFAIPDEFKNQALAIALAAISTQSQVLGVLDDPHTVQAPQCYLLQIFVG